MLTSCRRMGSQDGAAVAEERETERGSNLKASIVSKVEETPGAES